MEYRFEKVKEMFDTIKSHSSKNTKMEYLKKYENEPMFKDVLRFLLDSRIVTGLSSKKINKNVSLICTIEDDMAFLDYLATHDTGSDNDISNVLGYINLYKDADTREFMKEIATKSYKLGLDYKTANKVYGDDFIKTWEVMLGSGYDKLKLADNELIFISHKLNGNRCSYLNGKLVSRQGKLFKGCEHIIKDIMNSPYKNYFIDGELIRKNVDGLSDNENFRVGTGIANSDTDDKSELQLVIFDMFPANEFIENNGKSNAKYSARKKDLIAFKKYIVENKVENINIVNMFYEGTDHTQIMKWLDYAVEHDYEGCMINKDSVYENKRTTNLIKVKKFLSADLKVIGYEEGSGRLKGTLGALIVDYKGNTVNVGSGFDDKTRAEIWSMGDKIIGRVIEVKYKEVSMDKKTGLESLQFPIYQGLREIGKEVSYES